MEAETMALEQTVEPAARHVGGRPAHAGATTAGSACRAWRRCHGKDVPNLA